MAKRSLREMLHLKREKKALDPQFRDLILSFDAEYKPRAPKPSRPTRHEAEGKRDGR